MAFVPVLNVFIIFINFFGLISNPNTNKLKTFKQGIDSIGTRW
jgi:hypothetical protein